MPCQSVLFSQLTNESPSQSIFTHARQRIQAGEELQSAQSSVQEQEVESDKEAGSEGEDDDEEVMLRLGEIDYFRIRHNTLCLSPKFCIRY